MALVSALKLSSPVPADSSASEQLRVLAIGHCYSDPLPRQKWYALRDLAPECTVKVITPREWPDAFKVLRSQPVQADRIEFMPMQTIGAGYGSRYFYSDWNLVTVLREFQPHIIHIDHEPWSIVYTQVRLLAQRFAPEARMVVFSWWNTPRRLPRAWARVYRANVARTALLIAGNHGAEQVHRALHYRGPIDVIPQLGVDLATHFPAKPATDRRESIARGREFVVGFVGRLIPEKNVDLLLTALSQVDDPSWQLAVIGDGKERPALEAQAGALGLADRVSFVGAVPQADVADWIRCCDVLVLPSTKAFNEQFGHVLVEAMACGVAVVGSTSGEIPFVIGDAGLTFPTGDHHQLAKQLRLLISNRELLNTLGRRGRDRVLGHFTDDAIAQQTLRSYRAVLGPESTS